jgi:hypothetical protein
MTPTELDAVLNRNFRRTIRIVGENTASQFSSMWSFLGGNDGFYLASRTLLNTFKVSLHANNSRGYLAFAKPYFLEKTAEGRLTRPTRTVHEWSLPDPGDVGAALAVSIKLPADFMRSPAHPYCSQGKALIFGIEPTNALEIGIFLSREGRATLEEKFVPIGHPLFEVAIEDWLNVMIVVRSVAFDATCLPSAEQISTVQFSPLEPIEQQTNLSNLNMTLWNAPQDGAPLQVIDIGGLTIKPTQTTAVSAGDHA